MICPQCGSTYFIFSCRNCWQREQDAMGLAKDYELQLEEDRRAADAERMSGLNDCTSDEP